MKWLFISYLIVFICTILFGIFFYNFYIAISLLFLAGSFVGLIINLAMICPRCGTHLAQRRQGFFGRSLMAPSHCIRCGRGKRDVFPFQRYLKPET